ncbi:Lcl C-terminal domain-containing protein [Vibrio astriarenae]|uniref:Lcl C-terminal domain-containing protein n=1 Tax=Vibrio astriarenae TaxID=1481923 RepID=UPI0037363B6B
MPKALETLVAAGLMSSLIFPVYAQVKAPILPGTGQSVQYDTEGKPLTASESSLYTGQDASFEATPLRYQDNGDGTITDLNTGLMWQKSHDTTKRNLTDSIAVVEAMTLGGHDDWRLPTIKELYSLADFDGELMKPKSGKESKPYIDTDYFDFEYDRRRPFAGAFWSSTVYIKGDVQNFTQHGGLQGGFGFNFADGHIKSYETGKFFDGTTIQKSDNMFVPGNYVRAVRNTTTLYDMDYVDNKDGTVTDQSTGLMWSKSDSGKRMNWVEALEYAETATLAGHSDWRLPNAKELQSLVDYEKVDFPAIDTTFFEVTPSQFESQQDSYYFWTNTTQGDFKHTAVYVTFAQAWSKKNSDATEYFDWHGAGAQRSDPKSGSPSDYELASEMASDYISIDNWVRLVRDAK